jgi:hypothetical protein
MTEEANPMTCNEFQAQLPEMIGSGESLAAHAHLQHCALCRALLADLETIAAAARSIFPIVEPPDKVWKRIEFAIKNENSAPIQD